MWTSKPACGLPGGSEASAQGSKSRPPNAPFAAQQGPLANTLGARQRPVEGAAASSLDLGVSHTPGPSPSIAAEGRSAGVVPSHVMEASRGGNHDEPAIPPSSPGIAVPGPDPGDRGLGFTLLGPQLARHHRQSSPGPVVGRS